MKYSSLTSLVLLLALSNAQYLKVGGPLTTSARLLHSMFLGDYNFTGDVYYDLKNEGYYSPKVFEAYVSKPVIEV